MHMKGLKPQRETPDLEFKVRALAPPPKKKLNKITQNGLLKSVKQIYTGEIVDSFLLLNSSRRAKQNLCKLFNNFEHCHDHVIDNKLSQKV
mgnify:CR=1 FL=1